MVEDSDSDEYVACVDIKEQVCAVENPDRKDRLLVFMLLMLVTESHSGQLNTGATVNILHEESFKEICSEDSPPGWAMLKSAFTEEKPVGKNGKPLLSLPASEPLFGPTNHHGFSLRRTITGKAKQHHLKQNPF